MAKELMLFLQHTTTPSLQYSKAEASKNLGRFRHASDSRLSLTLLPETSTKGLF